MEINQVHTRKVFIVAQATSKFDEYHSNRYNYIFNEIEKKNDAVFLTSAFDYWTRKDKPRSCRSNIWYLYEPGYRNNLSAQRVISHFVNAILIFCTLLVNVRKGDILFVSVPSNSLGLFGAIIKAVKRCRLIIDIHDTWPESIVPLISHNSILSTCMKLVEKPWAFLRNIGIRYSDFFMGESTEYVEEFIHFLKPGTKYHTILLGIEIEKFNSIASISINNSNSEKLKVVFAGTIGANYDVDTIVSMLQKYSMNLRDKIDFYFWGDGEKLLWSKKELEGMDFVYFLERKPYSEFIGMLKSFDIGINSFVAGTNVKYSYKATDYLAAGVTILNNVKGSFNTDVERFHIGLNYEPGDADSLFYQLNKLIDEMSENKMKYKHNINEYVVSKLDRKIIYKPLFDYIEAME